MCFSQYCGMSAEGILRDLHILAPHSLPVFLGPVALVVQ